MGRPRERIRKGATMAGRRHEARGAFTLLELLAVIAIIAVLASLSFVAIGIVIRKAHVAQAGVELSNLQGPWRPTGAPSAPIRPTRAAGTRP